MTARAPAARARARLPARARWLHRVPAQGIFPLEEHDMDAVARPIDAAAVAVAEQAMLGREGERAAREILDSLCDPTRLKIVRALMETPLAASDLARVIKRSRAATSQHLRVLREVGAAVPARQGNVVRYSLSDDVSAKVLTDIGRAFERLDNEGDGPQAASG